MNVCIYILDGYEKMEVEVDSEINMVKEIKVEVDSETNFVLLRLISFSILISESTSTSIFS